MHFRFQIVYFRVICIRFDLRIIRPEFFNPNRSASSLGPVATELGVTPQELSNFCIVGVGLPCWDRLLPRNDTPDCLTVTAFCWWLHSVAAWARAI